MIDQNLHSDMNFGAGAQHAASNFLLSHQTLSSPQHQSNKKPLKKFRHATLMLSQKSINVDG
ncbi:MAG: hypothetical protein AB7F20_08145 [Geoalkalibacter sp.]|uniref:hypothetical protein n=1 Tax=Geoalkalibacter sp. TaxID=3041440 RepID=UPI002A9FEDBE|nr:hypothetical protein [Thermodesulfobacteriota bacterium]